MRWIEEALQRGRDPSADTSAVIPIRALRENVSSHPPNGMTLRRGEACAESTAIATIGLVLIASV